MNARKSEIRLSSSYPTPAELAYHQREARRLRTEFMANSLARLFMALDRLASRIACRLARGISRRTVLGDC
jgi:hypothetical protein